MFQSGFRNNHSTDTDDSGLFSALVLLDVRAAFTVELISLKLAESLNWRAAFNLLMLKITHQNIGELVMESLKGRFLDYFFFTITLVISLRSIKSVHIVM